MEVMKFGTIDPTVAAMIQARGMREAAKGTAAIQQQGAMNRTLLEQQGATNRTMIEAQIERERLAEEERSEELQRVMAQEQMRFQEHMYNRHQDYQNNLITADRASNEKYNREFRELEKTKIAHDTYMRVLSLKAILAAVKAMTGAARGHDARAARALSNVLEQEKSTARTRQAISEAIDGRLQSDPVIGKAVDKWVQLSLGKAGQAGSPSEYVSGNMEDAKRKYLEDLQGVANKTIYDLTGGRVDFKKLQGQGVSIASALKDGTMTPEDLAIVLSVNKASQLAVQKRLAAVMKANGLDPEALNELDWGAHYKKTELEPTIPEKSWWDEGPSGLIANVIVHGIGYPKKLTVKSYDIKKTMGRREALLLNTVNDYLQQTNSRQSSLMMQLWGMKDPKVNAALDRAMGIVDGSGIGPILQEAVDAGALGTVDSPQPFTVDWSKFDDIVNKAVEKEEMRLREYDTGGFFNGTLGLVDKNRYSR